MPAVSGEPSAHVLSEDERGRAREGYAVVVVKDDQLTELKVAGERTGLGLDPLHHVAVARDDVGTMVDDLVSGSVEARGQMRLGHGHAHRVAEPLSEGTGGGLHARRQVALRMTRGQTVPLAEALDLIERQIIAGQME